MCSVKLWTPGLARVGRMINRGLVEFEVWILVKGVISWSKWANMEIDWIVSLVELTAVTLKCNSSP